MAERDESRDVGVAWGPLFGLGGRCSSYPCQTEQWSQLQASDGDDWTRYVPHSDLEAAESERDALRLEVSRLVEALGIARRHVEKLATTRVTLCRLRTAIDQAIVNLPRAPITAEDTLEAVRREQLSDTRSPGSSGMA